MDQNYSVKSQMSVKSSVNSRFLGLSGTQCVKKISKEIFMSFVTSQKILNIHTTIMKANKNILKRQVLKRV